MNSFSLGILLKCLLVSLILSTMSCQSIKLDKTPPVSIKNVSYKKNVTGTSVAIYLKQGTTLKLDSVYFQGRAAELKFPDTMNTYVGYFDKIPKDLIMHNDAKEEYANQVQSKKEQGLPFELQEDECVIRYTQNDKAHYFKVQNMQEEK